MQFKSLATLAIATVVLAESGAVAQGQSGSTVVEETQAGSQQANNPLGPVGALAAAIMGCLTGWAGGI